MGKLIFYNNKRYWINILLMALIYFIFRKISLAIEQYFGIVTIVVFLCIGNISVISPLVIYLSSIRGVYYAIFVVTLITATTVYLVYFGMGLFIQDMSIHNIINLNFYFLAQILLILIIGTLFNEKRERELQLESLIEEAIEKNKKQAVMLSQQSRLAQMGEAINMIAHQWRQPLNILNGLVILMNLKISKQNSSDRYLLEKEFHKIETTTAYMSRTIDDFRDFFKPQKEKIEFDLKESVEGAIRLLQPVLMYDDIKIHQTYKNRIKLRGYPNEIGQVIINIINNAKDALISNRKNEEKSIYISIYKENKRAIITIQDNAGGIDAKIIDHIFDPYFSTKLKKNGTGLGLYISKMIIEEHMSGKLSVKNGDKGAIFKIEFKSS